MATQYEQRLCVSLVQDQTLLTATIAATPLWVSLEEPVGERLTWIMVDNNPTLVPSQIAYLASQRLGRLATTGGDHKPHVVPTSFHYNAELGTIDVGGFRVASTKKYRDVQANGWAAIVVDDLVSTDPWTPRMLEIRGRAEAIPAGGSALGPGFGEAFIRIFPTKINSYGID
jgi:pyridoxamine 5'-phosphate oxidase family protein